MQIYILKTHLSDFRPRNYLNILSKPDNVYTYDSHSTTRIYFYPLFHRFANT